MRAPPEAVKATSGRVALHGRAAAAMKASPAATPERAAHEGEVLDQGHGGHAADAPAPMAMASERPVRPARVQALAVGLAVGEAERVLDALGRRDSSQRPVVEGDAEALLRARSACGGRTGVTQSAASRSGR
jgi:hypothetical protein